MARRAHGASGNRIKSMGISCNFHFQVRFLKILEVCMGRLSNHAGLRYPMMSHSLKVSAKTQCKHEAPAIGDGSTRNHWRPTLSSHGQHGWRLWLRCHPQNGEHGSKEATDARLQTMARDWVGQVCMWMIMWEATESKNSKEVMNDLCADFSRYSYST